MLGHGKSQGAPENIFRLLSKTVSHTESIVDLFLLYCSRYTVLPGLYAVFGKPNILKFLDIFGGTIIKIPSSLDDNFHLSILPEISDLFDDSIMEKFLDQFSGTTIKIPPVHVIHHSVRDVDIYSKMINTSNRKKTVRELAFHYMLKKNEIYWIFRRVAKSLDPTLSDEELNKYIVPDEEVLLDAPLDVGGD